MRETDESQLNGGLALLYAAQERRGRGAHRAPSRRSLTHLLFWTSPAYFTKVRGSSSTGGASSDSGGGGEVSNGDGEAVDLDDAADTSVDGDGGHEHV